MVQIVAYEQTGTTQYELDVPGTPIELNYQFIDLNDPMSRRSPYSFRFTLPLSKENNKFFSFYYDANISSGTFDAMKKTECRLLNDGALLMQGSLQMYSVNESGYEVSILEQISQVFDAVKGLTWEELFTTDAGTLDTDLDHALTWDNVKDSWVTTNDITTGAVGDGTIVYPLSDSAQGLGVNTQSIGADVGFWFNSTGGMQDSNLSVLNLKPAIRVAYLIDYIFQKSGFTVSSTFLNSADIQKVYMFLATEVVRTQGRPTYGCKAGMDAEMVLDSSQPSTWHNILFPDESTSPFYDPDGLMSGGIFVAPYDGVFEFKTNIVVTSATVAVTGYNIQIRLTVDGDSNESDISQTGVVDGVTTIVSDQRSLQLTSGQTVSVWVASSNDNYNVTVNLTGADSATYFELVQYSTTSQFVDVSQNFPDVSVGGWLKAIVQRFNLVIISDPAQPTVIQIEPWEDWWDDGTDNKDWTEIVDQDSVKIEPTLAMQKKSYEFTDAEGENFQNLWWQHHFGWIKGKYSFLNENDFVTDEATTEQVFQPYRNRKLHTNIQNTGESIVPNVLLPTFWDWLESGAQFSLNMKEFVACKPVIAYYNGLQDIGNGYTFQFGGTDYTTYPYFAEFNTVGVTTTTKSLAWGYDYPDNFYSPFISGGTTGGTTLKYAFHQYWSKMFNEIYSEDSRVMTCKANLSYTDLYNLKFNDNIYLDGCFWRVLSVDNFAVGGNTLANVKLIKVIDKPPGRKSGSCSARPSSFNTDGTVNFVDTVTGAAVSPTEPCCTLGGYVWDESSSQCFSRNGGGGGGGGGTGGGGGNGGGGVGHDKPVLTVAQTPNSYTDFARDDVKSFFQAGVIGTNISTRLFAKSTSTTPHNATTDTGLGAWQIPIDSVVYVRLQALVVEVGGSAGTVGNTVSQSVQATVANTRTTPAAKSTARDVGSTTVIAENKDTASAATIAISSTQASAGAAATFSVSCTGQTNVNAVWFIDMELTTLQISGSTKTLARQIIYNLDPNIVEYADLTPDTAMYYNLPLL
jgi:hypothetical protein